MTRRMKLLLVLLGLAAVVRVGLMDHGRRRRPAAEHALSVQLCDAVRESDVARVEELLSEGADPCAAVCLVRTGDGVTSSSVRTTPLRHAVRLGRKDMVEMMLDAGADMSGGLGPDDRSMLHVAVKYGHAEIVELLLRKGARLHVGPDAQGWTPLHSAGSPDVAAVLLDKGVDVNAMAVGVGTPLHAAVREGRIELGRFLLDHGADVSLRDIQRATPLHYARSGAMAALLIAKGAQVDAQGMRGGTGQQTPLHYAADTGAADVARVLIENGADVKAVDELGWTPLHHAARCIAPLADDARTKLAAVLIRAGADVNARDRNDRTPLDAALATRPDEHPLLIAESKAIAELLRQHGAIQKCGVRNAEFGVEK